MTSTFMMTKTVFAFIVRDEQLRRLAIGAGANTPKKEAMMVAPAVLANSAK